MTNEIQKKASDLTKDAGRSLAEKTTSLKSKLAKLSTYRNQVLLCDISGSMETRVDNELRAIDVLNNVLEEFQGAQIWAFSGNVVKTNGKLPNPQSNTNMARAFARMKMENFKEIILLTDGQPDSEELALKESKGLIINIIYIGPKPTPDFLVNLAKVTGGKFDDVELIKLGAFGQKEIENKIKGFLSA